MKPRITPAELRERLRAGDPWTPNDVLDEAARARMRRAVLAAIPERRRVWRPRPVTAWAAVAALAAVLTLTLTLDPGPRITDPVPAKPVTAGVAVEQESGDAAQRRQVHFTTSGGTRVIWTLDPDLEL